MVCGVEDAAAGLLIERLMAQRNLRPREVVLPLTLIIRRSYERSLRTTAAVQAHTHEGETVMETGDRVLAVAASGKEEELRRILQGK